MTGTNECIPNECMSISVKMRLSLLLCLMQQGCCSNKVQFHMRLLGRQFENLGVFKSSYLLIANPRNIHTVLCSQEKLFITNIIAGLPIISKIHHYLGPRNPVLACSNVSYLEYAGIRLSMVLGNTQTLRILQLCYPEVEKTCPRY